MIKIAIAAAGGLAVLAFFLIFLSIVVSALSNPSSERSIRSMMGSGSETSGACKYQDLYDFLGTILRPSSNEYAQRMLYTEIATTIERKSPGTWWISDGMTKDGECYSITVKNAGWYSKKLSPAEADAEKLHGTNTRRALSEVWIWPSVTLVTLENPQLRVVATPQGGRTLVGTVRCLGAANRSVRDLTLALKIPSPDRSDSVGEHFQELNVPQITRGTLRVSIKLDPEDKLDFGGRLFMLAFLTDPDRRFYRVSNEAVFSIDGAGE